MKNQEKLISRKQWMHDLMYKIYHFLLFGFLKDCLNSRAYNHNVYDSLGIIDTLGYRYDEGKYTYSYSEELGGYRGVKLPFGWCLQFDDDPEPYVVLKKFKSFYE